MQSRWLAGKPWLDVVAKSGLREDFPEIEIDSVTLGIWGLRSGANPTRQRG